MTQVARFQAGRFEIFDAMCTAAWNLEMESLSYQEILVRLRDFYTPLKAFCNIHMSTFITHDLWNTFAIDLVPDLRQFGIGELDNLYQDLVVYCQSCVKSSAVDPLPEPRTSLEKFAYDAFRHACLLRRFSYYRQQEFSERRGIKTSCTLGSNKRASLLMMKDKKLAEVEVMAEFVREEAVSSSLTTVVDFGSGRGYLSAVFSMFHGLNVVGLEQSSTNISSASTRLSKLSQQWRYLQKTVRGDDLRSSSAAPGRTLFRRCTVDAALDLDDLVRDVQSELEHGTDGKNQSHVDFDCYYMMCGLHTCGPLANDIARIFVKNESAKAVVFVGCCYHFMNEEFDNSRSVSSPVSASLFPMSTILAECKFSLGRNARMLGSQSVERFLSDSETSDNSIRSLCYRAQLQSVLEAKLGRDGLSVDARVGRIDVAGCDFAWYVRKALDNLGLDVQVTDSDIASVSHSFPEVEIRLRIFMLLRVLTAPVIEHIILLDRLTWMAEQDCVNSVECVALFDAVISPRLWAITAVKKSAKV